MFSQISLSCLQLLLLALYACTIIPKRHKTSWQWKGKLQILGSFKEVLEEDGVWNLDIYSHIFGDNKDCFYFMPIDVNQCESSWKGVPLRLCERDNIKDYLLQALCLHFPFRCMGQNTTTTNLFDTTSFLYISVLFHTLGC